MATEPQHSDQPAAPVAPDVAAPGTAAPGPPPAGTQLPQHTLKRTRISGVWAAVGCFAVVLLLLLIALPGGARILQLRATARRHRHADARLPGTAQSSATATPSDRA